MHHCKQIFEIEISDVGRLKSKKLIYDNIRIRSDAQCVNQLYDLHY